MLSVTVLNKLGMCKADCTHQHHSSIKRSIALDFPTLNIMLNMILHTGNDAVHQFNHRLIFDVGDAIGHK